MDQEKFTLHRYYIWANRMRAHYDEVLDKNKGTPSIDSEPFIEAFMYMSIWYGLLFVVIEGWRDLKLIDSKIDMLLQSSNVDFLRLYRNSAFHFQPDYFNHKQMAFMVSKDNPVAWVRTLNKEFGRYFLDSINASKSKKI